VKRDTRFGRLVAECGAEAAEALCYGGEISHWTNNPWMARRQWLLETLVPMLRLNAQCAQDDWACRYSGGVERNRALQCAVRGTPHVVAQTTGLFRHLEPFWETRESCAMGEGYWWASRQQCRVWRNAGGQ
jgi:hypothetical protein